MNLIAHHRNTIGELQATNPTYSVEVDIRSEGHRLILHHAPFVTGESFEDWLDSYQHGTLILNVREEGLDGRLITLAASKGWQRGKRWSVRIPFPNIGLMRRSGMQGGKSSCA